MLCEGMVQAVRDEVLEPVLVLVVKTADVEVEDVDASDMVVVRTIVVVEVAVVGADVDEEELIGSIVVDEAVFVDEPVVMVDVEGNITLQLSEFIVLEIAVPSAFNPKHEKAVVPICSHMPKQAWFATQASRQEHRNKDSDTEETNDDV